MKKINYLSRSYFLVILIVGVFLLHGCTGTYVATNSSVDYSPPVWAPAYEDQNEVNYYYIPDIEAYYDVRGHNYVYYNQGTWVYTSSLPPAYSTYDMNSAYVVVLDRSSREPWHQHTQYVSRYPRYYYRNEVREQGARPARGFNENRRTPVYSRTVDDRRETNSRRNIETSRRNPEPANTRSREQNSRNVNAVPERSRSNSDVAPERSRSNSNFTRGNDVRDNSRPTQNSRPSTMSRTPETPAQRTNQPAAAAPQTQRNTAAPQPQHTSASPAQHNNPRQNTSSQPATRNSNSTHEDKKPASTERNSRR